MSFVTQAQISIRNISLINPDTNILYTNCKNRIQISGVSDFNYELASLNHIKGKDAVQDDLEDSQPEDNNLSSVNYDSEVSIIEIYLKNENTMDSLYIKKNGKIIAKKYFQVISLEGPKCYVAETYNDMIPKAQLLKFPKLSLFPNYSLYNSPYRISYSDVTIQRTDSEIFGLENHGEHFSSEFIEVIQTLKKGDIIYFENVKVVNPDQMSRNIGSRKIIIE